ncbi:Uncharacterised protein [Legionella wadsworthii]|uniref:Uncharacterized protein n=1 Tax=Legionella wadsworthii TaxID=28088 RepID=A0A378LT97_9GAMM|nr:hypothetical protein [Legionella wadsworthii]STY29966.1 Uncharacterised protein [Legionella wadsworthii]
MKNSRKQIIAQIELLDRVLYAQQNEVMEHEEYFEKTKITLNYFKTIALLVTAFLAGWTIDRMQMGNKVMRQLVDVGKLALLTSAKTTLVSLFNNNGRPN